MAHAPLDSDLIVVETQWNEREEIKLVPGARWQAVAKHWTLPLSWESCVVLRGVFGDRLTVADDLNSWAWKRRKLVDELLHLRTCLEPDFMRDGDRRYPFQVVGAEFLELAEFAILADEMGTGKTVQALTAVADDGPVLVICPNSVKQSWHDHVVQWTDYGAPFVVMGGAVQRDKILKQAATHPHAVVIVNYESLRTLSRLAPYGSVRLKRCRTCDPKHGEEKLTASRCQVHPKVLNTIPFRTVIIDEAHRIKDPRSQQTRAVWAV